MTGQQYDKILKLNHRLVYGFPEFEKQLLDQVKANSIKEIEQMDFEVVEAIYRAILNNNINQTIINNND
ncbi:MAG: hypothetical protein RLZ10_415 [Bacteroidota bacterium]|jgi:hypothetical protein